MTKLRLDFSLETFEERNNFLHSYLNEYIEKNGPLSASDAETCGNYLLWGKDADGSTVVSRHEVFLPTRWNREELETESLDALMEAPTFSETDIRPLDAPRLKIPREVFSRTDALKNAPAYMAETLRTLFHKIDALDFGIESYELESGARTKPIRDELLAELTSEERDELSAAAQKWTQYQYLKARHELKDLRSQQYALKDGYAPRLQSHATPNSPAAPTHETLGVEVPVFPLGLIGFQESPLLFYEGDPSKLGEEDLRRIDKWLDEFYYIKDGTYVPRPNRLFDFRNQDHVIAALQLIYDFEDQSETDTIEGTGASFLETMNWYMERAGLTPVQQEILEYKARGFHNPAISEIINAKYGKTYSSNYISTIFRQKIAMQIVDAAVAHFNHIQNIFFGENFKKCSMCGKWLLIDENNFVRKSRSKDGFAARCKRCDKSERQRKKKGE